MNLNSHSYKKHTRSIVLLLPLVVLLLSACDHYPKDLRNFLEKARGGTLLVGYTENPPWVMKSEKGLEGIEVAIVRGFAKSINAEIEWVEKNEQTLLRELEHHNLHLVIAGLTHDPPWKQRVGITNAYVEYQNQKHIIAVPPGELALLYELEAYLNKHRLEIKELFNEVTEE